MTREEMHAYYMDAAKRDYSRACEAQKRAQEYSRQAEAAWPHLRHLFLATSQRSQKAADDLLAEASRMEALAAEVLTLADHAFDQPKDA